MSEDTKQLMTLIQEEKDVFVRAEYGRLQSVMGAEYTENGEPRFFHPLPETQKDKGQPGNPDELKLAELAMLPHLVRAIPRLGTMSYMPLFRISPYETDRLRLLSDVHEKLLIGKPCTPEELHQLIDGHEEYMRSKKDDNVVVITSKY
ncbi:MAG: hypothetical protein IJ702_02010 [Fretibacterium sp.]|nr:hypothetical protein [Fretibacterium sp.]